MNKIYHWLAMALAVMTLVSCNDWLDVKPDTEEREKDMFTTYRGYKEALAGCYLSMASRSTYGEKLTMSDVDCLANLWVAPTQSATPELYYMHRHEYDNDDCRSGIKAIYGGLYNTVVQANMVINHAKDDASVFPDDDSRNVIIGEALAIRAYCHFDALRLFGQMPNGAKKTVSLPYSESNDINTQPSYYGFSDFARKVLADLDEAEQRLAKSDPILKYTFSQLSQEGNNTVTLDDDFMMYRRSRLNYWAVKALKARVYLYVGEQQKAYQTAKEVINAKLNGDPVVELSGDGDYSAGYYGLPHECLFALQNSKLSDYNVTLLGGTTSSNINNQLHLTTNMLNKQLYAGQNTTSNNRYLNMWERESHTSTGNKYPTIRKYYWNTQTSHTLNVLRNCLQIMPMLRLSEMYLIAMEATTDLAEANSLYKTYMAARSVNVTDDMTSLDDVKQTVIAEYRREFYGEGQMFYVYKRLGTSELFFSYNEMSDDEYDLPLPESEFDPNLNADKQ